MAKEKQPNVINGFLWGVAYVFHYFNPFCIF